jgi:Cof subfamily protein (haloacid dehalogenase superfamily)
MGYRLVALDIDGTIRGADRPVSDRTRRAIERVSQSGAAITLATGRMFRSAMESTAGLNMTTPVISYQGAHIADPVTGEVLWHRPLTPDMALEALGELASWQGEVLAYHADQVYVDKLTPWVEGYGERNRGMVHVVDALKELAPRELTRLVVVGGEDEVRDLELRLKASFDSRLHITRSLPHFCEILHPGAGKHNALAWLCRHLGISQGDTVAFGNGYNDVHMLEWAGLAVAVEGAVGEVLAVADRVAPPMEEDGAASVLEELIERGLVG